MLRLYDASSTTKIAFNADDGENSYFNNSGKVGIGTSDPDTELHIHQGNAGSVGTHANYILTLEGSSDVIMQFQTPNNRDSVGIVFGDPDDQEADSLQASYSMGGISINLKDSEMKNVAHGTKGHDTTEVLVVFAF